jgi:hypothetical protein
MIGTDRNPIGSDYRIDGPGHKMQYEKLYNLYKTTYFLVAFFIFKMDKVLSDQTLVVVKTDRIEFSLFSKQLQ